LILRADHSRTLDQAAPEALPMPAAPQTEGKHPQVAAAALRWPGTRCPDREAKHRDSGPQASTARPAAGKPPKLNGASGAARRSA
jgi:hypothetical protein